MKPCKRAFIEGVSNMNRRLTFTQATDIRRAQMRGETCVSLAKKYGVSDSVISAIVKWKQYKYDTDV